MAGLISVTCRFCYGLGMIRKRNMVAMMTYENCKRCNGLGRRRVLVGSGEERIARTITPGLGPGIKKHDNNRGWNRR